MRWHTNLEKGSGYLLFFIPADFFFVLTHIIFKHFLKNGFGKNKKKHIPPGKKSRSYFDPSFDMHVNRF